MFKLKEIETKEVTYHKILTGSDEFKASKQ